MRTVRLLKNVPCQWLGYMPPLTVVTFPAGDEALADKLIAHGYAETLVENLGESPEAEYWEGKEGWGEDEVDDNEGYDGECGAAED